jgi:hypothetical protein
VACSLTYLFNLGGPATLSYPCFQRLVMLPGGIAVAHAQIVGARACLVCVGSGLDRLSGSFLAFMIFFFAGVYRFSFAVSRWYGYWYTPSFYAFWRGFQFPHLCHLLSINHFTGALSQHTASSLNLAILNLHKHWIPAPNVHTTPVAFRIPWWYIGHTYI